MRPRRPNYIYQGQRSVRNRYTLQGRSTGLLGLVRSFDFRCGPATGPYGMWGVLAWRDEGVGRGPLSFYVGIHVVEMNGTVEPGIFAAWGVRTPQ